MLDNNDPTTLNPNADALLRREITAFKPIGVTDYARFITNKDKRSLTFTLGCPNFNTELGRFDPNNPAWYRGGPLRVNGDLEFFGSYPETQSGNGTWLGNGTDKGVNLYLRGTNPLLTDGTIDTSTIIPVDSVEVAGNISVDYDPAPNGNPVPINLYQIMIHPTGNITQQGPFPCATSDSGEFNTYEGMYRDGSNLGDNSQLNGSPAPRPRGIKRIEPPLVDQPDVTNTTTRYRLLTLNSGSRVRNNNGQRMNLGSLGWGRGVYINNTNDVQNESQTLFGGYTLRYDWIKPNNPASRYWVGPYYVPPAAIITLRADDFDNNTLDGHTQYYFTITRTDTNSNGQNAMLGTTPEGTNELPGARPSGCRIPTRSLGGTSLTSMPTAIPK